MRKKPRAPHGPEQAYEAALRRFSQDISAVVRAALRGPMKRLREEQRRADARDFATLDFGVIRARVGRITADRAQDLVDRYGSRIASWNRQALSEVLNIPLSARSEDVQRALAKWQRENVDLISSISERLLDDVHEVISDATEAGTRVEVLSRRLAERYDVSQSRAELIARDQTLKANADLTRIRHEEAGVTRYVWSTSRDERVRPMHAALEGQIFSWDDPPVTNEDGDRNAPGEDYQCRCVAIPVLDDQDFQSTVAGPRTF